MAEDPILQAVDEVTDHGYLELVFDEYVPPTADYDDRGEFIQLNDDPFKDWDDAAKREIMRVIAAKIPAYPGWWVLTDGRNKMAYISLRTLMGTDKAYAINLTTHDLCDRNIIEACGQICERYKLPRDRLDMPAFLRAREMQSRLLYRHVKVPE